MPHKCARCSRIYQDNAPELMNGCECGSRVFLYLRDKESPEKEKKTEEKEESKAVEELKEKELSGSDLDWIEEMFHEELEKNNRVLSLDVENLTQVGKGKFQIDLTSLMKGDPLVVKSQDGIYYIDIVHAMQKKRKEKT